MIKEVKAFVLSPRYHIPALKLVAFYVSNGRYWELNYRKIHSKGYKSYIVYNKTRYYLKELSKVKEGLK